MTIANWYKWANDASQAAAVIRPKVIPGFDRLDDQLLAVLREQEPQKSSLKRKQAGGGQKRRKPRKPARKPARISAPRLLEYQKLYADNLKDLQRCATSKSSEYKFRSRPVPDFEKSHQLLQLRKLYLNSRQKLTRPKGPRTLAASLEAMNKRQNEERKRNRPAKSIPKINPCCSMDYMLRKPFSPRREYSFTRPKPFKLHTEQRAVGRYLFDEGKRMRMEERFEQLANDWLESEQREFLKQRKLTNFKANPNPWSKATVGKAGL